MLRGGDSGRPAVLPSRSAESELIRRVTSADEDTVMPPRGERLSTDEVALLRAWIDEGAKWNGAEAAEAAEAAAAVEGATTGHWSFQPLAPADPPACENARLESPVDAFVVERLRAMGLEPSPEAEELVLIRRLFFDLHGLPPPPEEIAAFLADPEPRAWTKLVDRALASPRYGERWARHWLDTIRFAESDGFETNHERPRAYVYRDWVIAAWNEDMPYDRFVRAQIAGDALGEDAATGFLVGGPRDIVKSPDPVLTAMQRQDELADMVHTTGTAFLGLTLGCARCHDHKFDPVLQKDYYSIQAVFAGVQHGERLLRGPETKRRARESDEIAARIAALDRELEALVGAPRALTGRTVFLDDGAAEAPDPSAVVLLAAKRGHGTNPPGAERGRRDDPGGPGRLPNVSGGTYTWWENVPGADAMAYRPRVSGRFRIWVSWGCGYATHTRDASYLVDLDGDPGSRSDQAIVAVADQQRFADGSGDVPGEPLWSGFLDAGVHELRSESALILRSGTAGQALTADAVIFQEEAAPGDGRDPARPSLREPVNPLRNVELFEPVAARFVRFTVLATNTGIEPCIDELEVWPAAATDRSGWNVALAGSAVGLRSSGDYSGDPKHRLEHLNDGRYGNDRSWISNEHGRGWVEIELGEPLRIERVVWGRDRNGAYRDRLPTRYRLEVALEPGEWRLVASSDDRAPHDAAVVEALPYRLQDLSPGAAEGASRLRRERARLESRRAELAGGLKGFAGTFSEPPVVHRLYRGDPMTPREVVMPDALSVLGTLGMDASTPERERRRRLAEWIASPENPLTARVIANRIWQYHFGTGLVDTPSDFGGNGSRPSHAALLDWLAGELIRSGWSLKHLHRVILLSRTYRQSSAPRAGGLAADARSRFLWRFPPRRLEAEAIRDGVLFVSGALDLRMGGPGFSFFEPNANYARNWIARDEFGPEDWRRMVYALKIRMELDSVFGAFDCPDAGQICPRRNRSTTPIQALSLFNSGFVREQARVFAERLKREAGPERASQVRRGFLLAFGREPDPLEEAAAVDLVAAHGLDMLTRALLNANEFLFLP